MSRPLDGLLVVSLQQAIAAPCCTRPFADQGEFGLSHLSAAKVRT
jgi:crotonobetainyl-CoA:carnitine CoA-transferase CaiB-like acyl-CoA transferase